MGLIRTRFFRELRQIIAGSFPFRMALYGVLLMIVIAISADFLANEKPIYCHYDGQGYWPVLEDYFPTKRQAWPEVFHQGDWSRLTYSRVIFPLIPYGPRYLDLRNSRYIGPWNSRQSESLRWRHWLGTDAIGRDVLAGMIHGTRSALIVGLVGAMIAGMLGLLIGGLSGYYGDDRWQARWPAVIGALTGGFLGIFLARQVHWVFAEGSIFRDGSLRIMMGSLVMITCTAVGWRIGTYIARVFSVGTRSWPLDLTLMRLTEAFQAMPGLLLVMAMIPLFTRPSVWNVVWIVGLIRWPGMARLVRGELLRIRGLPYMEAAWLGGVPHRRLWWRHALPNALQPWLVLMAFSISSGILLEAFLSFIGLGVSADEVTWGSMLQQARKQFSAWWLAIFPGLGILLAILSFNMLGEAIQEWIDKRKPWFPG